MCRHCEVQDDFETASSWDMYKMACWSTRMWDFPDWTSLTYRYRDTGWTSRGRNADTKEPRPVYLCRTRNGNSPYAGNDRAARV